MIDSALINELQATIFKEMFVGSPIETTHASSFEKLSAMDAACATAMLGLLGERLRKFVQVVDCSHPDLMNLHGGILAEGSVFSKRLNQFIEAWSYAKEQGWEELLSLYRKVAKNIFPKPSCFRNPVENHQLVRLIADPQLRGQVRKSKSPRLIQLGSFYKRGENGWYIQPDTFEMFVPHSKNYETQLAAARTRSAHLQAIGCESMSRAIVDSIKMFVSTFENHNCHGFYRLTATNAAIILAKMHGYIIQSPCRNQDARMVRVPDEFRHFFEASSSLVGDEAKLIAELQQMVMEVTTKELGDEKSDKTLKAISVATTLVYAPTLYPLETFIGLVYPGNLNPHDGRNVLDIVKWLEAFPLLGSKPLFDHFLVMVPSPMPFSWEKPPEPRTPSSSGPVTAVAVPNTDIDGKNICKLLSKKKTKREIPKAKPEAPKQVEKQEFVVSYKEQQVSFTSIIDAKIYLDRILIQENLVKPILLGERDGQCYFVCFWD